MFTENGLMVDLDEVRRVVSECDVFTIGFRLFPSRLIIDTRRTAEEGPMVEIVEAVGTVEERFFWLGQRRPQFGVPERFTFFVWPHSIGFLVECGLVERIRERVEVVESGELSQAIDEALAELKRLEEQSVQEAFRGENYHTLWPAS